MAGKNEIQAERYKNLKNTIYAYFLRNTYAL